MDRATDYLQHVQEWVEDERERHLNELRIFAPVTEGPSVAEQVRQALQQFRMQALADRAKRLEEKRSRLSELQVRTGLSVVCARGACVVQRNFCFPQTADLGRLVG